MFSTSAAVRPVLWSIRMSSGASCAYANPRSVSSSCRLETPRSNRTPCTWRHAQVREHLGQPVVDGVHERDPVARTAPAARRTVPAPRESRSSPTSRSAGNARRNASLCPPSPTVRVDEDGAVVGDGRGQQRDAALEQHRHVPRADGSDTSGSAGADHADDRGDQHDDAHGRDERQQEREQRAGRVQRTGEGEAVVPGGLGLLRRRPARPTRPAGAGADSTTVTACSVNSSVTLTLDSRPSRRRRPYCLACVLLLAWSTRLPPGPHPLLASPGTGEGAPGALLTRSTRGCAVVRSGWRPHGIAPSHQPRAAPPRPGRRTAAPASAR